MWLQEVLIFTKQHIILIIIWFFLLIVIVYSVIINWICGHFEVSCDTIVFLVNKKNAIVIDIRNSNEYAAGYIINSVNIPYKHIKQNGVSSFKEFKNHPIIIIHNMKSVYSIIKYFKKIGFLKIYVLKGGINSWKDQKLPLLLKK